MIGGRITGTIACVVLSVIGLSVSRADLEPTLFLNVLTIWHNLCVWFILCLRGFFEGG